MQENGKLYRKERNTRRKEVIIIIIIVKKKKKKCVMCVRFDRYAAMTEINNNGSLGCVMSEREHIGHKHIHRKKMRAMRKKI